MLMYFYHVNQMTISEIARLYDTHPTTIARALRREGVPPRPRGRRPSITTRKRDLCTKGRNGSVRIKGKVFPIDCDAQ